MSDNRMTAQGEDILAYLDRTITERERIARSAARNSAGCWIANDEGESFAVSDDLGDVVVYNEGAPSGLQPDHIALNDPASVLRRCAADRKLIELHRPVILRGGGGAKYFDTTTVCTSCEPPRQFPENAYPCPTLRALAEGYGWTEGES